MDISMKNIAFCHIDCFSNKCLVVLVNLKSYLLFVQCLKRRTNPTRTQASDLGLLKVSYHDLLARFKSSSTSN